jgi:hypothetical protein
MEQIEKFPRPLTEVGRIMIEMTSDLSERQKLTIAVLCLFAILAKAYKSSQQKIPIAIENMLKQHPHKHDRIKRVLNGETSDPFPKETKIEDLLAEVLKHVHKEIAPFIETFLAKSDVNAVVEMFVAYFVKYLSFVFFFKTWNEKTALQREVAAESSDGKPKPIQRYIIDTYITDIISTTPTTPTPPAHVHRSTPMPPSFITLCFCDVATDNTERLLQYLVTNIRNIPFNLRSADTPRVSSPDWGPTTIYTSTKAIRFRQNALENDPSTSRTSLKVASGLAMVAAAAAAINAKNKGGRPSTLKRAYTSRVSTRRRRRRQ